MVVSPFFTRLVSDNLRFSSFSFSSSAASIKLAEAMLLLIWGSVKDRDLLIDGATF
jgi:hypothetical protein